MDSDTLASGTDYSGIPSSLQPGHGPRRSVNILQNLLRNLGHLDFTGRIKRIEPVMAAHGGYCDVFAGFVEKEGHGEVQVAIKRLRAHIQGDRDFAKALARELRVWSSLIHPNILPLWGYTLEGNNYPALISEWMINGTALSYMKRNSHCDVLFLIFGIAEGLEYLHEIGIIHSDMKAENVLISVSGRPLLCDFGLSHIITTSQSYAKGSSQNTLGGSARWMAVELLEIREEPAQHSKQSDVWAFGMTAYELLTKKLPYYTIRNDIQVLWAIVQGVHPVTPVDLVSWPTYQQEVWSMCHDCWHREPSERVSIADVVDFLSELCNREKEERLKQSRLLAIIEELEKVAINLTLPNPHDSGMSILKDQQPVDYLRLSTSLSLHLDGFPEGPGREEDYFLSQRKRKEPGLLSTEKPDELDLLLAPPCSPPVCLAAGATSKRGSQTLI